MQTARWKTVLLLACLFLTLGSCAVQKKSSSVRREPDSSRQPEPGPAPAGDEEGSEWIVETAPPPEDSARPASRIRVDGLLASAHLHFRNGKRLFEEGRLEEARREFNTALGTLEGSELEFSVYPEVEATYHDLLQAIQTLEVTRMIDPVELQAHSLETSPLDQIGAMNLGNTEVNPLLESLVADDLRQNELFFPMEVNKIVLQFVDYYQGRGRDIMEKGLQRAGKYLNFFRRVFQEEGVPEELVFMAHVESLFSPRATSRARAKGIWQFMAGTGRLYGLEIDWWVDDRMDVEKSTRAAARHLRDLYQEFQDWPLVLAAYNAGPGRVRRNLRRYGEMDFWTMARRRLLPRETRNHVPSILAAILVFRDPKRYGFQTQPDAPLRFDRVKIDYQVDLQVLADALKIPVEQLRELNPELRRNVTPFNSDDFSLRVPLHRGEEMRRIVAELPEDQRLRWAHHKVRQGETLSELALRYKTSVGAIAATNRIRNVNRLRLGQDLIIPLSQTRAYRQTPTDDTRSSGDDHIVRRGDSLHKIARRYGVTVRELSAWNDLKLTDVIYPGQRIRVRAGGSTQPAGQ